MQRDLVVVFDCGATNLTVVVVDAGGKLVASSSRPNATVRQPGKPEGWLVWDLDALWASLTSACRECLQQVDSSRLAAMTVTTWGADGTPVDAEGKPLYPPISWQDCRTEPLASTILEELDEWDIYRITGYQVIPFNTLLKLRWLHENEPQTLQEAHRFLMMPGLLSLRLCGQYSFDATSAGTMMAMDMSGRRLSSQLLQWAGVDEALFPPLTEPGCVIGHLTAQAAADTGLPAELPVVAAGHDTQFAAVGCGAGPEEVILSSGTWEILMQRTDRFAPTRDDLADGLLTEADAQPGQYNPQLLMMGSGVIEWLRGRFFADATGKQVGHDEMMAAAAKVAPGADGITVLPSFVPDTGPQRRYHTAGTVLGLKLGTERDELYRATLEGLSYQLRQALEILARSSDVPCRGIRAVGGGSRNALWNQIRADVCGLPVTTIEQREATVLGAAMFAFTGAGLFRGIAQAQAQMVGGTEVFEPSAHVEQYESLYQAYATVGPALREFYRRP
jgi:L-fuculokinase